VTGVRVTEIRTILLGEDNANDVALNEPPPQTDDRRG
jgi:hypothetical protein